MKTQPEALLLLLLPRPDVRPVGAGWKEPGGGVEC